MYYYIYDSFLNDNKYQKILHRIENRIVDLGINGKISRMSMLISPEKMVREEIKKGAKTIIVVGNDKTLDRVLGAVVEENVTLGIIPVGKENSIAKILGIPEGSLACDIISQRRITKIDLIKANDKYCLSNIAMKIKKGKIICEDNYELSLTSKRGEVFIYNLANKNDIKKTFNINQDLKKYLNPNDGMIDILIKTNPKKTIRKFFGFSKKLKNTTSIIPVKELRISEKEVPSAICDNSTTIKAPLKIKVIPNAVQIIISKNREF
jgi:diacylglycerol kinase family enzyme